MSIYPPDMKPSIPQSEKHIDTKPNLPLKEKPAIIDSNQMKILGTIKTYIFFLLLLAVGSTYMLYKFTQKDCEIREFQIWKDQEYYEFNSVSGEYIGLDKKLRDWARRGYQVESVTRVGASEKFDVVVSTRFDSKYDKVRQKAEMESKQKQRK